MEPNKNEFTNKDEVFFIEYNGVIKDPNQYLIYLLFNELYDSYKEFLYIDEYKGATLPQCLPISSALEHDNLIKSLARGEMEFDKVYHDLLMWSFETYGKCDVLAFGDAMRKTLNKPFCKSVYFYTPYEDKRVIEDIINVFGQNPKISYCHGDMTQVIEQIPEKITAVVLANFETIYNFLGYSKIQYTEFLLADYHRNSYYDASEDKLVPYAVNFEDIFDNKDVRIHTFNPMLYRESHLQGIVEPVLEDFNNLLKKKQEDKGE